MCDFDNFLMQALDKTTDKLQMIMQIQFGLFFKLKQKKEYFVLFCGQFLETKFINPKFSV